MREGDETPPETSSETSSENAPETPHEATREKALDHDEPEAATELVADDEEWTGPFGAGAPKRPPSEAASTGPVETREPEAEEASSQGELPLAADVAASADISADAEADAGEAARPESEPPAPEPAPPARAPAEPAAVVPAGEGGESFGRWLRRQRVVREIDLREIADSSKISLRYLQALEDERFDLLPAPVFANGFLRQYARYVGIDPEEVVNFFSDARRQQAEEKEDALASLMGEPPKRSRSNLLYGIMVLVVVAALVALVWWLSRLREDRQAEERGQGTAVAARPARPGGEAEGTLTPAEAVSEEELTGPLRATLDFNGECWVEVHADGERELSERHVQGESLRVDADRELILNLGNEAVVELVVNGHPYRPDPDNERRWLRFTREQLAGLERGEPIEPLEVPVGEGSPRRPPPPPPSGTDSAGAAAGATGTAA